MSAYIRSNTLTVAVVNGEGGGGGGGGERRVVGVKVLVVEEEGDLLGMGEGRVSGSRGKTGSRGSGGN